MRESDGILLVFTGRRRVAEDGFVLIHRFTGRRRVAEDDFALLHHGGFDNTGGVFDRLADLRLRGSVGDGRQT